MKWDGTLPVHATVVEWQEILRFPCFLICTLSLVNNGKMKYILWSKYTELQQVVF